MNTDTSAYCRRRQDVIIRLLTFIFRKMTREEKLEAIYKEMANKELTFGCLVKTSEDKIEMICSGLVNE